MTIRTALAHCSPLERFERLAMEKCERILEMVAQEFAEHGIEGASINHWEN